MAGNGRLQIHAAGGRVLADVLSLAHRLRVEAGNYAIRDQHPADALALLSESAAPATPAC